MNSNACEPAAKIKVLVADDHAAFRRTVRSIFPEEELEIIESGDGYDAMRTFAEHRPGWVLMDINMGAVDGLTAADALHHQFPEARIVMLTSHEGEDLRVAARNAGAMAYVRKDNIFEARDIIIQTEFHRRQAPERTAAGEEFTALKLS